MNSKCNRGAREACADKNQTPAAHDSRIPAFPKPLSHRERKLIKQLHRETGFKVSPGNLRRAMRAIEAGEPLPRIHVEYFRLRDGLLPGTVDMLIEKLRAMLTTECGDNLVTRG